MLRVMDRLETGLILEVLDWDEVQSFIYSLNKFFLRGQVTNRLERFA